MNISIYLFCFLFLILQSLIKCNTSESFDNNIEYSNLCLSPFTINNYQYDLLYFQDQLLEYHENLKNDTFLIEICSSILEPSSYDGSVINNNNNGPCKMGGNEDSICLELPNGAVKHLGYSSTLKVISDQSSGLILSYIGGECYNSKNNNKNNNNNGIYLGNNKPHTASGEHGHTSKQPDMESSISNDADNTYYYNTTISIICDTTESAKIITASFNDECELSIIIKSHYVCGIYKEPTTQRTFSTLEIVLILLGSILSLALISIIIFLCRNRIRMCCCRSRASRVGLINNNGYLPINHEDNYPPVLLNNQNNNIIPIDNNINLNNNIQNHIEILNNENNNNVNNNNNNGPIFYNHEILQGQTPNIKSSNCIICWERSINTVILNCGHAILCMNCSKLVKDCPVCRQPLLKIIQVYHITPYDD